MAACLECYVTILTRSTVSDTADISGSFEVTSGSDGFGVTSFSLPAETLEFVAAGDTISFLQLGWPYTRGS